MTSSSARSMTVAARATAAAGVPPPPARMTAYIRPILRPAPLPNGNRSSRATGNLTIFHDERTDRPSDALFAALPRRSSLVREIRRLPVDHRPRQHERGSTDIVVATAIAVGGVSAPIAVLHAPIAVVVRETAGVFAHSVNLSVRDPPWAPLAAPAVGAAAVLRQGGSRLRHRPAARLIALGLGPVG